MKLYVIAALLSSCLIPQMAYAAAGPTGDAKPQEARQWGRPLKLKNNTNQLLLLESLVAYQSKGGFTRCDYDKIAPGSVEQCDGGSPRSCMSMKVYAADMREYDSMPRRVYEQCRGDLFIVRGIRDIGKLVTAINPQAPATHLEGTYTFAADTDGTIQVTHQSVASPIAHEEIP